MKTIYIKRIVLFILLLEVIIVAVMLINCPGSKFDIVLNKSGGYTLRGVSEKVSDFVNEKILDLTSASSQGSITSISSISIVRSDRNLLVLRVGTAEASEYTKSIDGNDIIDYKITGKTSYELWFDFTDMTDGVPAYTLMSDEDKIYYWRSFK